MDDIILTARSPLSHLRQLGREGKKNEQAGVTISEVTNFALANLTAFKDSGNSLAQTISDFYDLELPTGSSRVEKNGISFIGVGPDQWLAMAYEGHSEGFVGKLANCTRGLAAVVDQSDARAMLRISGSDARKALSKGVSIDLDPSVFTTNCAATSLVVGLWVNLWQITDIPAYEISVFRAFGKSMLSWITSSSEEFGLINQ